MRSQLLVLAAAVFMIFVFPHFHVEAAISGNDGGTVAEHFQKNSSEDTENVKNQQDQKEQLVASSSNTVWMFVKVLLVLAVVIALIYFLLRFVNARTKSFANGRAVQNVGGVSVGSNRSVQLVKVGDRVFIVGV
ncbi:MAG TPA: flagellar biosynthetic protein FliO, partial [Bacillales bacterium]